MLALDRAFTSKRSARKHSPMMNIHKSVGLALVLALLAVVEAQRRPPNYSVDKMPDTEFDCSDKLIGGYYGDAETECQMFHVCVKVPGIGIQDFRFLCPNDTAFDQENQICDDWYNIDCESSSLYLSDNFDLYRIGASQSRSTPRTPFSKNSPTPIPLGPSTPRPGSPSSPGLQNNPLRPGALPDPPRPRAKPIASNHAHEEEDDFFLQRADTGDRRLHQNQEIFKSSQSGNFFNSKNGGKDDDDDYEPDSRPNAFRHSQKAKPQGPLPQFVQQYQHRPQQQQQQQQQPQQPQPQPQQHRPQQTQQQQYRPQQQTQQQAQQQTQQQQYRPQQTQQPTQQTAQQQTQQQQYRPQQSQQQPQQQIQQQTQQQTQRQQYRPQQTPAPQQTQQQNYPEQNQQNRKKKVTVRRKLVQKPGQEQPENFEQPQPRRLEDSSLSDDEYYSSYQDGQKSNYDNPSNVFGQRGNFPATRTTLPQGTQTTVFQSPSTTLPPTTVDAARNHNYQTKARYNTIQRSRETQTTEYYQPSPSSTASPQTTQKQYSLFYAKNQQQQQQLQQQQQQQSSSSTNFYKTSPQSSPTPPAQFQQQRVSSTQGPTSAAQNFNNRFNYNTYKLNGGGSTASTEDYDKPEDQEFLKTAHSSNYRPSDFNSFNNRNYKDNNNFNAYNTKQNNYTSTTSAGTTKSTVFPTYFPTSPRPAPFSTPQTTAAPKPQYFSQSTAAPQPTSQFYNPSNAPRPFSPSPSGDRTSPQTSVTSNPSTVAAFNNNFQSSTFARSGTAADTAATYNTQGNTQKYSTQQRTATAAVTQSQKTSPAPPKKFTAKVVVNPAEGKPLSKATPPPKNDYDYAYYDDDAGAYEYGLDPISDTHFAKTRTDVVKTKKVPSGTQ